MPFEPIATQEEFDERVKARLRRERELRGKVSKETGVPAELIVGDDEESMTAFARSVVGLMKPPPALKYALLSIFGRWQASLVKVDWTD